ncbi:MAG TPA: hypothetical protein EYM38_04490 [Dehalococcoidia bacterium]|nr:hypothetical protein [Dehalococcoidia bacterium]
MLKKVTGPSGDPKARSAQRTDGASEMALHVRYEFSGKMSGKEKPGSGGIKGLCLQVERNRVAGCRTGRRY